LTVGEHTPGGYERYYGLVEPPFSLTPNPRFLFESRSHSAAFEQVRYALARREPIILVTGETGTGKTMLCRTVLEKLEPRTFLSIVTDPLLGAEDLLTQVLDDFGVLPKDRSQLERANRHDLIRTLEKFVQSLGSLKAHAVIMVDEAQHLKPEVLEQIRLLSNFENDENRLLQIVLVGQPGLEEVLGHPEMRQLEQRITRRHRLEPLGAEEVRQYIERRIAVAHGHPGGDIFSNNAVPPVGFTPDAMQLIATLSGGLPRIINVLCDRSLEIGCQDRQSTIDRDTVLKAARAVKVPGAYGSEVAGVDELVPARPSGVTLLDEPEPSRPSDIAFGGAPAPSRRSEVSFHDYPAPSRRRIVIAAAAVAIAVVAAAAWFATRSTGSEEPSATAPPRATTAPPPDSAAAKPIPPPPPTAQPGVTAQAPTAAPGATAPPAQAAPPTAASAPATSPPSTVSPAAAPPPAAGAFPERFRIVVASFRTEGRTNTLAEEVKALGLPVYTRFVSDWYQVIVGPYTSRDAAVEAQQKLSAAQILDTAIISNQPKPKDPTAAVDPAPAVR
jgi:type II secretory pathway predicted ATPase ExeA/cell division septation protein DedD